MDAVRAPIKFSSVLLGNIPGASFPDKVSKTLDSPQHAATKVNLVTTSQRRGKDIIHPLVLPDIEPLNISFDQFKQLQKDCPSLKQCWKMCEDNIISDSRAEYEYKFVVHNGLMYKEITKSKNQSLVGNRTLVIPRECVKVVLKVSHDVPIAGHFSHRKTAEKVNKSFYWPKMYSDIYKYCRSCDKCQRVGAKGRVKHAPMIKLPIVSIPFEKVAIDLVGPLTPTSSHGHRCILTMIDYANHFPEAVPSKGISSIEVAEALMSIFSRVSIPKQILSDRGLQFTSEMIGEVYELVGVKPIFTSPQHPMANGRVERQHAVLKSILKKLCSMKPKEWDRYIPAALFAMRETPNDSLGFSPFEMLYCRQVRGPLAIFHELWANPDLSTNAKSSYQFVFELREKLEETAEIAADCQIVAMDKYKTYFDLKNSKRTFNVGDEVLVLLPDNSNKLLMSWRGPFKVLKVQSKVDYIVDVKGKAKLFHVNLLKRYYRRADNSLLAVIEENDHVSSFCGKCEVHICVFEPENSIDEEIVTVDKTSDYNVSVNPKLRNEDQEVIRNLLHRYKDIFF